jgi:hypothetical protein
MLLMAIVRFSHNLLSACEPVSVQEDTSVNAGSAYHLLFFWVSQVLEAILEAKLGRKVWKGE